MASAEDIAREAAGQCFIKHLGGDDEHSGLPCCVHCIADAIRSAVQSEKAKTEAIVNAELQTAAVSVSRGIQLGREEATRRYETVVEVLTRTLERLRSRGDK